MSRARYDVQHFDIVDGGRSWHVYDNKERIHIHTATQGFLKEDKSEPICCTKICEALNTEETSKEICDEMKTILVRLPTSSPPDWPFILSTWISKLSAVQRT